MEYLYYICKSFHKKTWRYNYNKKYQKSMKKEILTKGQQRRIARKHEIIKRFNELKGAKTAIYQDLADEFNVSTSTIIKTIKGLN